MTNSYPLKWPPSWKRTKYTSHWLSHKLASFNENVRDLLFEMSHLDAQNIVVSTNIELRNDGTPRAGARDPTDAGVAVYFDLSDKPRVLACDRWDTPAGNVRAIVKHVNALRGQTRWGVGSVDRAFDGYVALPAQGETYSHWKELGLDRETATVDTVEAVFKARARKDHPDLPTGSHDKFVRLQRAREAAIVEIEGP